MADTVFLKLKNGRILRFEGKYAIHQFVIRQRQKYEGLESVRNVCNKIDVIEPDPWVRDKIMARFFSIPECVSVFERLWKMISNGGLEMFIREVKDHLTYLLFPMAPEFDRRAESEYGLRFGGALMRSLAQVKFCSS